MSDEEDDYLSDKFLSQNAALSTSSKHVLTYAERRRQALRASEFKNVQNRKRSRREIQQESLREGLSKSLFEKAAEDGSLQNGDSGNSNKAMSMMLKMGYKPGQSLGVSQEHDHTDTTTTIHSTTEETVVPVRSGHLVEPIRVELWTGRQGVGKRKRNVSPTAAAKLAKLVEKDSAEERMQGSYRDRARAEYEEKRAEGRLHSARQTCITLDEEAAKKFNVYWLDPQDPETFPPDLLQILTSYPSLLSATNAAALSEEERLRRQMRADALQPSSTDLEDDEAAEVVPDVIDPKSIPANEWPQTVLEEVKTFISADARTRLKMLLEYLRSTYFYCFWCGTRYEDAGDLKENCPGSEEEDHD